MLIPAIRHALIQREPHAISANRVALLALFCPLDLDAMVSVLDCWLVLIVRRTADLLAADGTQFVAKSFGRWIQVKIFQNFHIECHKLFPRLIHF